MAYLPPALPGYPRVLSCPLVRSKDANKNIWGDKLLPGERQKAVGRHYDIKIILGKQQKHRYVFLLACLVNPSFDLDKWATRKTLCNIGKIECLCLLV